LIEKLPVSVGTNVTSQDPRLKRPKNQFVLSTDLIPLLFNGFGQLTLIKFLRYSADVSA
jgi:hypothetical protein